MKRLLTCLLALAASPALSQGFEASVLAGYRTPGEIQHDALGIQDLQFKGSFTWGASAGYFFSPRLGVEASWARQESAIEIATAAGKAEMLDVNVNQLQGAVVLQMGGREAKVKPYLSAGAGAAFFSAPGLDGEAKLSFGFGGGLKWMPSRKVGARLQARYTPTYLSDTSSDYCDPFGFCQSWLHQFELTGGVIVRF
jgi:opacity protein-like surface antigen